MKEKREKKFERVREEKTASRKRGREVILRTHTSELMRVNYSSSSCCVLFSGVSSAHRHFLCNIFSLLLFFPAHDRLSFFRNFLTASRIRMYSSEMIKQRAERERRDKNTQHPSKKEENVGE